MSGPGPGPGGRGGWSPIHFRPCSPYGISPPPRMGSPGANMMGSRLPPHMACPRPRWPTAMSPVPMGMSPPPIGPRPFRLPMHPVSNQLKLNVERL
ncbi:hypothetical protein HHI36_007329 [Cryptolaemus montrouzieri]|uniref:Uncharacterized protein n=1 Tax=Cryptolaemus montrouzieri TaxID=559131 RepID=A0ABD2MPP5_9CUCU